MKVDKKVKKIEDFIKESLKRLNREGVVVGISGGIDSAVCAGLAVLSVGRENVFGLILPERETSPETVKIAKRVAEHLRINYRVINITPVLRRIGIYGLVPPGFFPYRVKRRYALKRFKELIKKHKNFYAAFQRKKEKELAKIRAYIRAKNRVRMVYLYFYAELFDYAVMGTLNRIEIALGFYVRHGDGASDIMPIAHLLKSDVKRIADYINLPSEVIERKPTPDLVPGLGDEDIIGFSYSEVEEMIKTEDKRLAEFLKIGELFKRMPFKIEE